jgi:hypothetical protein
MKKMHIGVRNFIESPYVVRVDYPNSTPGNPSIIEFREMLKTAKKTTGDTWGYSAPEYESTDSEGSQISVGGLSWTTPIYVFRSYWIFSDIMDATAFRLTSGDNAKQVHMWPATTKFTITEFIEDTNSD